MEVGGFSRLRRSALAACQLEISPAKFAYRDKHRTKKTESFNPVKRIIGRASGQTAALDK